MNIKNVLLPLYSFFILYGCNDFKTKTSQEKNFESSIKDSTSSQSAISIKLENCSIRDASIIKSPLRRSFTESEIRSYINDVSPTALSTFIEKETGKDLVTLYFEEAAIENVSADLAIAQALHETNVLQFGGELKADQFNFGGLAGPSFERFATFENDSDVDAWKHPTAASIEATLGASTWAIVRWRIKYQRKLSAIRKGVRAHIQHLKAYASDTPISNHGITSLSSSIDDNFITAIGGKVIVDPGAGIVDPRFTFVVRKTATNLESIGKRWSHEPGYAGSIFNQLMKISLATPNNRAYGCTNRQDSCGLTSPNSCDGILSCSDGVDKCTPWANDRSRRWCINVFQDDGQWSCLESGAAPDSFAGNFIFDTIAGIGAGGIVRSLTASGVRTVVSQPISGGAARSSVTVLSPGKVLRASDEVDAWFSSRPTLQRIIEEVNPMSGTPQVGFGNCGNAAIATAFRLMFNRYVCAIPYTSLRNSTDDIVREIDDIFPDLKAWKHPDGGYSAFTLNSLPKALMTELDNGDVVLLTSRGWNPTSGAHGSLVLKLDDFLFHINNQNWNPMLSGLTTYLRTWDDAMQKLGDEGLFLVVKLGKLPD